MQWPIIRENNNRRLKTTIDLKFPFNIGFSAGQSDESIVLSMVNDMLFRVPQIVEQATNPTTTDNKPHNAPKGGHHSSQTTKDVHPMPTTVNGLSKFVSDVRASMSQNQFLAKKQTIGSECFHWMVSFVKYLNLKLNQYFRYTILTAVY